MSSGFSIGKLLQWRIMVIFFFILTVNVIYTAYINQSFEQPVREIGDKMVGSLSDINYQLERVADNKSIFRDTSDTIFKKFMDFFVTYTSFMLSLFAFTIWIVGIQNLLNKMNGSNPAGNYIIAWIVVMLINGIYIVGMDGFSSLSIYFDVFKNFIKAFPYLIQPFKQASDSYYVQNTSQIMLSFNHTLSNVSLQNLVA